MVKRLLYNQDGLAMPMVVMIIAIVCLLGFTAAFVAESQVSMGTGYAGSETALGIAEAGVNNYIWHLNQDSTYYKAHSHVVGSFGAGQYSMDITAPTVKQPLTIISTGSLSNSSNQYTIKVSVSKRAFTQYVWMTDSETDYNSGQPVYWGSGDTVNGPLATNGWLNIDGSPTFNGTVQYGTPYNKYNVMNKTGGSNPQFTVSPYKPTQLQQKLTFPVDNGDIKKLALNGGFYNKGRTCIYLHDGKYDIVYYNGSGFTSLKDQPIPSDGVIYIDGTTPSYKITQRPAYDSKYDPQAGNVFVSGQLTGQLTIAAANDIYITDRDPTNTNYDNATITTGLTYHSYDSSNPGACTDMLGLIANGSVRVLKSNWSLNSLPYFTQISDATNNGTPNKATTLNIYAAIMSVDHDFEYENIINDHSIPYKGTLHIVGSIIQKNRGIVWNGYGGWYKLYEYDQRMANTSPVYFLEPVTTGWYISRWERDYN